MIFTNSTEYRADIDGLRAVAVLAVLGFHAFPYLVPGGFTGVDVFFVISGYLISRHIFSDLQADTFSTSAFYARRIKRIFPALILVLMATTAAGWVMLTPGEYELLGRPIAGGAGFVANFVFWNEAGYFDTAADTKPLLHLWSLGIEEQFYIVWPFILALLWRRTGNLVGKAILALLCLSLLHSMWLVQHNVTADFYSPLSRFWELALGAGLAYLSLRGSREARANEHQLLSLFGVALIGAGIAVLDSKDPFPGAWALLPTLGTACLVYSKDSWINRYALASRPLVWIGLISYPLYLWHWPLLSFARIIESETPSVSVRLWLLAISVLLAWLTYRFIERPVRKSRGEKARRYVMVLCLVMTLLFAVGITIRKMDGFKFRVLSKLNGDVSTLVLGEDRGALPVTCGLTKAQLDLFQFCRSEAGEPPRFAVLGDSKAEALFYGLARESSLGTQGMLIGSVMPPRKSKPSEDIRQRERNLIAFDAVLANPTVRVIVLANALRSTFPADGITGYISGDTALESQQWLQAYSREIRKFESVGKRVVFFIDNPTLPDPRSCISGGMTQSDFLNRVLRRKPNPRCTIQYTQHREGTAIYRRFVDELANMNPGLTVYDPTPLLCDIDRDECSITHEGKFLYSYSDHLSDYANSRIARQLLPVIKHLMR